MTSPGRILVAACIGLLIVGAAAAQQSAPPPPSSAQPPSDRAVKYRLVFHISENNPQQWQLALNNAFALQKNVGADNSRVEIVANGPGLNMLKLESAVATRIAQALDRNIDVVACGETMANTRVTAADLIGGVRVVPGGLVEIADRTREGWTYIRP